MFDAKLGVYGVDIGARGFDRNIGFQAADRLQMLAASARVRERAIVAEECPQVGAPVEMLGDQRLE